MHNAQFIIGLCIVHLIVHSFIVYSAYACPFEVQIKLQNVM